MTQHLIGVMQLGNSCRGYSSAAVSTIRVLSSTRYLATLLTMDPCLEFEVLKEMNAMILLF
jgi:hypothetical protein